MQSSLLVLFPDLLSVLSISNTKLRMIPSIQLCSCTETVFLPQECPCDILFGELVCYTQSRLICIICNSVCKLEDHLFTPTVYVYTGLRSNMSSIG